ncbi:hypothetical protein ACTWLT_18440 [Micromonospora sp. ZYX-F-536]|uniref:hypothetical protein n=1 Tax=Micromonospora sp. ZYX-F-536 TaxID=3457629 RepID=UPI004040C019
MSSPDQPSASASRRPSRRIVIVVAAVLVPVLLVAAGVVTYFMGGLNDDGQFRAEPPACETVQPSLHLLATAYAVRLEGSNSCSVFLPKDHPAYIPTPVMTIDYYVATPQREDAPDAASGVLRKLGSEVKPLSGVGDEAYSRNRSVYVRVSNLVVGVTVFPLAPSPESQIHDFAADLAERLRRS